MLPLASFLSLSSAGVTTLCFNGSFDAAAADDSAPLSKGLPPSDADETLPTADRFSLELRLFAGHSALCKALASHCVHHTNPPPTHTHIFCLLFRRSEQLTARHDSPAAH